MYNYQAAIVSVTDGDTVRFLIDMGMYVRTEHPIRLKDVFAPELSTPEGKVARDKVILWMGEHAHGRAWSYILDTEKDKRNYTRFIGEVTCSTCGSSLNAHLRSLGYTNQGTGAPPA